MVLTREIPLGKWQEALEKQPEEPLNPPTEGELIDLDQSIIDGMPTLGWVDYPGIGLKWHFFTTSFPCGRHKAGQSCSLCPLDRKFHRKTGGPAA
jgi:hypothetical protein